MIRRRIAQYIKDEQLFSFQDKLIVALSGGADSVALLHLLCSLGYTCEAAHCNFHLRGEESNRDEQFVRNLCKAIDLPLHVVHFETEQYAAEKKISIEMAARELRYEWFEKLKVQTGASFIAVAHHRDDSVETLLLNLIRGTGIQGLLGIRPRNGAIVRPLLCVSRDEVIHYLHAIGQDYVTDSTNLEDEYTRNKIRLNLLPLMEEINPSVKSSIQATSNHLNDVFQVYTKGIEEGKLRINASEGIRITALLQEPSPEILLFETLYPLGFTPAQIQDVFFSLQKQSGKQFISKNGCRLIKDRELLLLVQDKEQPTPPFELIKTTKEHTKDYIIPRSKHIACFDAAKLKGELSIRKCQHGDAFIPFGMKGRKLLSDYMTDRKFSLDQKEKQWLLCCGETIAWVIGERTDNRFRIDESTTSVVEFRMKPTD